MATYSLTDSADVEVALNHPNLAPPPAPATVGAGSMAELRGSMARFSHGVEHAERRRQVETVIDSIELSTLGTIAEARAEHHAAAAREDGGPSTSWELASLTAVESLAVAMNFGSSDEDLRAIAGAVEVVVRAIGRGEATGVAGDLACDELAALFTAKEIDPVGGISVLYQVFDAIVALCKSVKEAERTGQVRGSALAGTVRVAVADGEISGLSVDAEDQVNVAFKSADQEFGAGPHQCPGSDLAWILVDALLGSNLKLS